MVSVTSPVPAVLLDRDGTINVEKKHVYRIEDWEWIDGAQDAIKQLNQAGFKVIVISNQSGIARGMYRAEDVDRLHAFAAAELTRNGAVIDAFLYCPHHPEFGDKRPCGCRKPEPGLLLQAATTYGIDLSRSWMIGDKMSDVQAGKKAGTSTILVRTGHGMEQLDQRDTEQLVADDLAGAVRQIIALGAQP